MFSGWKTVLIVGISAALLGCYHEEPAGPVALSGEDVRAASDQMAADLLALPQLNADTHQWTIVVGTMRDDTTERGFGSNYNIFLARLKTNLARMSQGRVTLIQNKGSFHALRGQELENGGPDEFGQTGGGTVAVPRAEVQPDYELDGVAHDLPNRGSNYFLLEFNLNNLRDRTMPWSREYDVTVPR